MEHHAYVFDYDAFSVELLPVLKNAISIFDTQLLENFIDANIDSLTSPLDATPLDALWRDGITSINPITPDSINELGALALTRYYDPLDDIGLLFDWDDVWDFLEQYGNPEIMLGMPLSRGFEGFELGGTYSYLQSPEQVAENLKRVEEIYKDNPEIDNELDELVVMFQRAARALKGLYIILMAS